MPMFSNSLKASIKGIKGQLSGSAFRFTGSPPYKTRQALAASFQRSSHFRPMVLNYRNFCTKNGPFFFADLGYKIGSHGLIFSL